MLRVDYGSPRGACLLTEQPFAAGDIIARFDGCRQTAQPTRLSIQIGPERHIDDLGLLAYLNHSCAPNTVVDTGTLALVALRDIAAGEELTFFYPSTEWDMASPFTCLCGAPQCLVTIAGARYLPPHVLRRYMLSPHIRELAGL